MNKKDIQLQVKNDKGEWVSVACLTDYNLDESVVSNEIYHEPVLTYGASFSGHYEIEPPNISLQSLYEYVQPGRPAGWLRCGSKYLRLINILKGRTAKGKCNNVVRRLFKGWHQKRY